MLVDPDRNGGEDVADCRVVLVGQGPDGSEVVNVRVLYADDSREWATGLRVYETRAELVAAHAAAHPADPPHAHLAAPDAGRPVGVFLPERGR